MAADRAASVRVLVAENRETTEDVLNRLATDPEAKVRVIVAKRIADPDIRRSMLTNQDKSVRLAAANSNHWHSYSKEIGARVYNHEFFNWIANAEDEEVRAIVAEHRIDTDLHQQYLFDVPAVTIKLARNKSLSEADKIALAKLTTSQDTLAAHCQMHY